ncbi:MAG: hypothetical protein ACE5E5_12870 [Phycisphaerae bacterium]
MTSQDQPDLPKNDGEAGSDELAELDVDALLDQASSLAEEISSEVGESADQPDNASVETAVDTAATPEAEPAEGDVGSHEQAEVDADDVPTDTDQVEAKLDSLQCAVDALDVAVSDAAEDATDDLAAPDDEGAAPSDAAGESDDTPVGDGDTSAGDEESTDLGPSELDLAAVASDLGLDTDGGGEPAAASAPPAELSAEELASGTPPESTREDGTAPEASDGRSGGRLAPLFGVLKKVEPLALRVATLCAFVLEMLDRPLGRIGNGIRSILGLSAIATTATAIIVFVVSFL